jgi:hypothetical protein
MCDQTPQKSRDDTPDGEPQEMPVDHLRRAADRWRNLGDPALMAKASDEIAAPDEQPATASPW